MKIRIHRPKEKIRRSVEIPDTLRSFLRSAHTMISRGDERATTPSDDLIQTKSAYGGLIEEGGTEYGFTFLPRFPKGAKWEICLTAEEIQNIVNYGIGELELWGCSDQSCGAYFAEPDSSCLKCDYVDEPPKLPDEIYEEKMEWGREFFDLNPEAKGYHIRMVVQRSQELTDAYTDFSSEEIAVLIGGNNVS